MTEDKYYHSESGNIPQNESSKPNCSVFGDHHEFVEYKRKRIGGKTINKIMGDEEWTEEYDVYRVFYQCDCGKRDDQEERELV